MGSKNGKYDFDHGTSSQNHNESIPSFSSELNQSITTKKSKKNLTSLPTCTQQNILIDISTTNMDNLSLVWLDTNIHQRLSNIDVEVKLKNLIDYVRIFDRVDACERYIKQIGRMNNNHIRQEKLLVIISTTLAPTLIPHLHDLPQVKYIYIFGKSKSISKAHEGWLRKHNKVKGIYNSSRTLIAQIVQDQN